MDARALCPLHRMALCNSGHDGGCSRQPPCLDHLVHHRSATSEEDCTHLLPRYHGGITVASVSRGGGL